MEYFGWDLYAVCYLYRKNATQNVIFFGLGVCWIVLSPNFSRCNVLIWYEFDVDTHLYVEHGPTLHADAKSAAKSCKIHRIS